VKIVFIAGMGRSGSTLLDLLLGGHPEMIGLGEVYSFASRARAWADDRERVICSCGSPVPECEFWAPVFDEISGFAVGQNQAATALRDRAYDLVLERFQEHYGPEAIMVDSSKNPDGLQVLSKNSRVDDLKVLHLVKDVRAYVVSMLDRKADKRDAKIMSSPVGSLKTAILNKSAVAAGMQWYRGNARVAHLMREAGCEHIEPVSYDQLCLQPEDVLRSICRFIDLSFDPEMLKLEQSGSHNILGNRMRNDPEKRSAIRYDNRWFHDRRWAFLQLLCRGVMSYNSRFAAEAADAVQRDRDLRRGNTCLNE